MATNFSRYQPNAHEANTKTPLARRHQLADHLARCRPEPRRRHTLDEREEGARRIAYGEDCAQVAADFGVTVRTVRRWERTESPFVSLILVVRRDPEPRGRRAKRGTAAY